MAKNYKEWYLKGYEEGLKDAWDEVSRLATKGHTAKEIQLYVRSRKASIQQMLRKKEIDIPRETVQPSPQPETPPEPGRKQENRAIKPGYSYLVQEDKPDRAFSMMQDMKRDGKACLVISRTPSEQLMDRYSLDGMHMIWLTNRPGDAHSLPSGLGVQSSVQEERISPSDLTALSSLLVGFLKRNRGNTGILLEGLEYMSTQNQNFQTVLKFIQYINENVVDQKGNMIVVVGRGFNPEWYRMLAREMSEEVS